MKLKTSYLNLETQVIYILGFQLRYYDNHKLRLHL